MAIYVNRQAPQSGLASILAQRGRMGDTELVHMTKPEVQKLMNTGLMTLNPKTGLPEYFLGSIFKGVKNFVSNIFKPKNLVPMIASIALPAFAGPAFGAFTGLGPLASSSILAGLGTTGGKLLTGSDFEEAATAGVLSGGMKFGMGKLGQALGPDPVDGTTMSAKKFAKQRPSLLGEVKGSKDYLDIEGDLLEYGMDDLSNFANEGGLHSEGSILNQLNQLQQSRIGNYPNPIVAQAPVLPRFKNSNFESMDFVDDQGIRILAEGRLPGAFVDQSMTDGLSKAQSLPNYFPPSRFQSGLPPCPRAIKPPSLKGV